MDFDINENELVNLVTDFKNNSIQEKKELAENEEFLKFVNDSLARYIERDWGNTCPEDAPHILLLP